MKNLFCLSSIALLFGCVAAPKISRVPQSAAQLELSSLAYQTRAPVAGTVNLRTGKMNEANGTQFKGCVLYLQGLADSIRNHNGLFSALSSAGYKVIAFDYQGQGGSSGSMNHTRIDDPAFPGLEIGEQAKAVWAHYSAVCGQSKKFVIGWSTGGLATYKLAKEEWADAVVLIAPGIHPNKFVGEAAASPLLMLQLKQVITERTLTKNSFENTANPHVDPIKPVSPAVVPLFASNLVAVSLLSRHWTVPASVKGLLFLSGEEDTYVDREATKATVAENAPHFTVKEYDGALHEIDNEVPAVANDMISRTVRFFDSQ